MPNISITLIDLKPFIRILPKQLTVNLSIELLLVLIYAIASKSDILKQKNISFSLVIVFLIACIIFCFAIFPFLPQIKKRVKDYYTKILNK